MPNAIDALGLIRQRLGEPAGAPAVRWGAGATVGELNEDAPQQRWMRWRELAQSYAVGHP